MFVVLLEFTDNKSNAAQHMAGHNEWIARGFADGVFVLLGGLKPGRGGAVLAHDTSLAELRARVDQDPFVAHGVVLATIHEIAVSRTDERMAFLGAPAP